MISRPLPGYRTDPSPTRQIYDHELVYGLTGAQRLVIDGHSYTLGPDQLMLIPPRVPHYFHSVEGDSIYAVHFDWIPQQDSARFNAHRQVDELSPVDHSLWREPQSIPGWDTQEMPSLDLTGRPRVRELLGEIIDLCARGDAHSQSHAGAVLATAVYQISYEARLFSHGRSHHESLGADAIRRVQRARELLESPRRATSSVSDIAEEVGWSSDHLRRVFRQFYRTSPHRAQNASRVREAKELLRNSNMSIADVALRTGFDDPCYFSRAFKKECGLSPSAFVKQCHGG